MNFSKLEYYIFIHLTINHIELEDFMKPGISRNAKNQCTYNNFVHCESKKFQIKNIENDNVSLNEFLNESCNSIF